MPAIELPTRLPEVTSEHAASVERDPPRGTDTRGAAVRGAARAAAAKAGKSRMCALRERILAKEQEAKEAALWHQAVRAAEGCVQACEHALEVLQIVEQLFARDEGAAVTDAEVLSCACSQSSSTQSRAPMERETAEAALICLISHAEDWFKVEEPQHTTRVRYFLR